MSDASDTIHKRKSVAVYIDQLSAFIYNNPDGDCGKFSTCTSTTTNCTHSFKSYAIKSDFLTGKNICTGCDCKKVV